MTRYAIQYEKFDDPDWSVEMHIINADSVDFVGGVVVFENSTTGESFIVPADRLVAAWSHGDEGSRDDEH